MNIKPVKRKILVQKCTNGEEETFDGMRLFRTGALVLPEMSGETTHWARIEAVAKDCKFFDEDDVGNFIRLPEYSPNNVHRVPGSEFFIVRESVFESLPNRQMYMVIS